LNQGIKFFTPFPIHVREQALSASCDYPQTQAALVWSIAVSAPKAPLTLLDIEEFIESSVDIVCMATDMLAEGDGTRLTQRERLEIAGLGETFRFAVVQAIQRVGKRSARRQKRPRPRLVVCGNKPRE
jgi:hypothetical protein